MTSVTEVVAQMAAMNLPPLPAGHPVLDGKYKRFGPQKKGWYILRELQLASGKTVITGAFGIFQGENRNTVPVSMDFTGFSDEERADFARKQKLIEEKEAENKRITADLAANRALDQWNKSIEVIDHPYLTRKQITAESVRINDKGQLLIPMKHYSLNKGARLVGLQKIDQAGTKLYNKGMDKIGAAYLLGTLSVDPLFIGLGEGYATCRSVRMGLPDLPVMITFDAGNIVHIALSLRRDFPHAHLLFLADDDYQLERRLIERLREEFNVSVAIAVDGQSHDVLSDKGDTVSVMAKWCQDANGIAYIEADIRSGRVIKTFKYENAGVSRCTAAAKLVGNASVVIPRFANRGDRKLTDFNDLHVDESLEQVAHQIGFSILAAQRPVVDSSSLSPSGNGSASDQSVIAEHAGEDDPLYDQAVAVVQRHFLASISLVQRHLRIGYNRAARLLQQMEEKGVVSAMQSNGERIILVTAHADPENDEPVTLAELDNVPFSDSPAPPAAYGDAPTGDLFGEGGGGEKRSKKDKPKKVYDADHWDQVNFVLKNFILVYGEDLVWDEQQRMLMKISAMRTIVQNHDVMKFWGGDARKWVLKKNIVFDPQETPSPAESGPTATVNLFNGWKMRPKKGDCLKIQTLLLHLCDGNEELALWVSRWLAYPLRHRGAKMETSIIMHGDEGSGKNLFFERIIKRIYGEYGYVIGNAQLESQFNDWASMRLFMVADEVVTRSELKQMKGKLKYLVSGDSIIINPKGLPEHSEANCMNFVFLSNELQPLALDKTDRRYLVIWTPPALPREFYEGVAAQIDSGGVEAFYHFLLYEVDMGDFNQHTKPLYTDAKDSLIEKSLTPAERFYRDWSRGFLPLPFITVGVTQLFDAYRVWCERSGESKYISQTIFSPTVERYAGGTIRKKIVTYEFGSKVKQSNVFLVGEQPEGKTQADWVTGATALFESSYKLYRTRNTDNNDG